MKLEGRQRVLSPLFVMEKIGLKTHEVFVSKKEGKVRKDSRELGHDDLAVWRYGLQEIFRIRHQKEEDPLREGRVNAYGRHKSLWPFYF